MSEQDALSKEISWYKTPEITERSLSRKLTGKDIIHEMNNLLKENEDTKPDGVLGWIFKWNGEWIATAKDCAAQHPDEVIAAEYYFTGVFTNYSVDSKYSTIRKRMLYICPRRSMVGFLCFFILNLPFARFGILMYKEFKTRKDMFYQSLNQESLRRINNIVTGFKNHPMYASYTIRTYCHDVRAGVHAIEVGKNGHLLNLWLFYPGSNGEINSIAVYGSCLQGHLSAVRNSMTVFGMPVESVGMDYSGRSDFVDIYLKEY